MSPRNRFRPDIPFAALLAARLVVVFFLPGAFRSRKTRHPIPFVPPGSGLIAGFTLVPLFESDPFTLSHIGRFATFCLLICQRLLPLDKPTRFLLRPVSLLHADPGTFYQDHVNVEVSKIGSDYEHQSDR